MTEPRLSTGRERKPNNAASAHTNSDLSSPSFESGDPVIAQSLKRPGLDDWSTATVAARRPALRVALIFAAFATAWIFASDYLLGTLVRDVRLASDLQTVKGMAFVLASSCLMFFLLRSQMAAALDANYTLCESVDRLGFITENAKVGYSHWVAATRQMEWSPVGKRLMGIPADERMTFARFLEAVHPDDRERVDGAVRACLNSARRPGYHIEFRVIWPDGTQRWIEAIGSATFDGNAPIRTAGISFDITERRKVHDALLHSEARHRSLIEATGAVTWSCPPDGLHVTPQTAWMAFTGQSESEMLGAGWALAVHPDDREAAAEAWRESVASRTSFAAICRFRRHDGAWRWVSVSAAPVCGANGEIVEWFGMNIDITERRQAEDALRQSETRHRSLVEATSAMTWSCLPDGTHITPNPAWIEFTGQSAVDMLGRSWSAAVHPEDREDLAEAWDDCLARGVAHAATARCRRRDGEWRWMSVSAIPLRGADGQIVEWFGMNIDITEHKELERKLEGALAAANAANDAQSQFVANMSHELRTPMGGVIGMLEVLLRTPLSDEQRDHVATALKSARDLTHVLNDVLDLSAVEAGKVSIEFRPFDMREMLAEKVDLFGVRCAEKGVRLTANAEVDVPHWLAGDVRRLCQVMHNLIGNALKYTNTGTIDVTGRFDAQRGIARIEVRDTGIGIPEAVQANLFKRFYQADSTASRLYGGSGLGLAICRQLVELMGGEIGVSSSEGVGSTFWFEFPTHECDAPDVDHESEAANIQMRPLRVLVAEDNLTAQRIIRTLLNSLGHDVTIVDDGAPAVAAAASGAFDVILMDVMMPGMDGATATREIRELGGRAGGVPIIALTADVLFGKDHKYLSAGMTDYVSKPIDVALLAAALRRASAHTNFARS